MIAAMRSLTVLLPLYQGFADSGATENLLRGFRALGSTKTDLT